MVIFYSYVKLPEGSHHKSAINPRESTCLNGGFSLFSERNSPHLVWKATSELQDGAPRLC